MIELPFAELAARVKGWYRDERLSHQAIADRLTTEGIAPALGAEVWSWQAVDKVMVHCAAQRRALAQDATS